MKSLSVFTASLIAGMATTTPTIAHAEGAAADGTAVVTAVINYDTPNGPVAETFFEALSANHGKVIALTLEIVPRQDSDSPGYTLSSDSPAGESENVLCGNGTFGIIDNFRSTFRLDFQHPEHFHAPTEIRIGDRINFPFQAIRCGIENHGSQELSHLHINGHFVVMSAEIPTAMSYVLYPYNP